MRKTKIICTIGPASDSEEILSRMCLAGMNVARLNFSHGTHEEHLDKINKIKAVRAKLGLPVAILLDTKGPEYRIGTFKDGKIVLHDGDDFTFTTARVVGDESRVSVSYENLHNELQPGDRVLVNNGLLIFEVVKIDGKNIRCKTLAGGEMSNRKSMSFPDKVLQSVYLSEQDKSDLLFGIAQDVDFVACSFVSCAQDLRDVKAFLDANGGSGISLIAKIENRAGIDNIKEICQECDGIMIGRGDMGVEMPYEQLPGIQKKLITKCRLLGKRVITATEMLESMIEKPRPTRAEISDVANAVYDGSSAVMLSGETAMGKYPVETITAMGKICEEAERGIDYVSKFRRSSFQIRSTVDAISHATVGMAIDIGAKAVVACSLSGVTARMISRFRPPVDIIGLTVNEKTYRQLSLSWGVIPVMCEVFQSIDVLFYTGTKVAATTLQLEKGDRIVITGGLTNGVSGNTNLIKVETI